MDINTKKLFSSFNEAKNYLLANPGGSIVRLDNNEGYCVKLPIKKAPEKINFNKDYNKSNKKIETYAQPKKNQTVKGICIDCKSQISQARLDNVKGVLRCAPCQEKYELNHPESIIRKAAENPIGSREDFKNMSNKQFGTNSKTKF
jgi:hypothetical protein